MPSGVLITLTDLGSLVGPFDLYSNIDGYTTPFETNLPVSAFTYGYFTTTMPYGTTIIRVKSDGDCINFIDLSISNLPTLTPTTTSTPTVTPTNTPSQTNTQTPSATFNSSPTQTPSQTATPTQTITKTPSQTPTLTPTTTGFTTPCVCVEITATNTNPEGPAGTIEYNNCFGTLVGEIFSTTGTRYRCIDFTGGVIQVFNSTFVTYSIASGYSCVGGTCPTGIVIPLTPTPTQTPSQTPTRTLTPTPSSTFGSTPTQTPSNTATPTNTQTNTQTPSNTPTLTPSSTPSSNYTISWTNNNITTGTNALRIYKNSILIVEQFGLGSNSFSVTSSDVITYNLTSTTPDFTDVQIVDSDYGTISSCGFNSATIGQSGGYTYSSNATIDGITTNYIGGCP